jgi:hypothetical protein
MEKSETIEVSCARYITWGDTFDIPIACLDCHEIGLILVYNHQKHRMEAICDSREDAKGRNIQGCNKVSFVIPMIPDQFYAIIHDPHTRQEFFICEQLSL